MEITWRVIRGEGVGEKVQGLSSTIGRYKIDTGRSRTVLETRSQRTYMYDPWTWTKEGGAGGRGVQGGQSKGGEWDNCNSIINKIYFLKMRKDSWTKVW